MRSNLAASDANRPLDTGLDVRLAARAGALTGSTAGLAPGFVRGNPAILPRGGADQRRIPPTTKVCSSL